MTIAIRILIVFTVLLTGAVSLHATPPPEPTVPESVSPAVGATDLYTTSSPFRLFDPSKLTMRQSYSLSYFSGGSAGPSNIGVYMNSIGYQLARPLYVQLDLGLYHTPGALLGGGARDLNAQLRPNFYLRYAPSNKFQFILDVRTMPLYDYGMFRAPGYGLR